MVHPLFILWEPLISLIWNIRESIGINFLHDKKKRVIYARMCIQKETISSQNIKEVFSYPFLDIYKVSTLIEAHEIGIEH